MQQGSPKNCVRASCPDGHRRATLLFLALGCLLLPAWPRIAGAAPRSAQVALTWVRSGDSQSCLSEAALRQAVEQRLGRRVFTSSEHADLRVRATLKRLSKPLLWQAEITMETPQGNALGQRVLTAPGARCSALNESLALVLALLVDRSVEPTAPPEAAPSPADPPSPLHIPEAPSPAHASPAPAALPWSLETGLGGGIGLGTAIPWAAGPMLWAAIVPPHFTRVLVSFTHWLPGDLRDGTAGARFEQEALALELCPKLLGSPRLEWDLCLGQRLTRIQSQGFGYDENSSHVRIALGWQGSFRGWWHLGKRFRVGLGLGAVLSMARDQYVYGSAQGGQNPLQSPSLVTGFTDLSLGLAFR